MDDLKTTLESRLGNVLKNTGHGIKKYELTETSIIQWRCPVYRIRALISFKTIDGKQVKAGDLGGWIASEDSLSQEGLCWVRDEAKVVDEAKVYDNALISGDAKVYDNAEVYGNAKVFEEAHVYRRAKISGDAKICGVACVHYNVNSGKITE